MRAYKTLFFPLIEHKFALTARLLLILVQRLIVIYYLMYRIFLFRYFLVFDAVTLDLSKSYCTRSPQIQLLIYINSRLDS